MAHLLLKISGNKYINHTFFKPYLYIYDDLLIYKKRRRLIKVEEITVTYNHIVQVYLHRGLIFSTLELVNSGVDNVTVKGVWKKKAMRAKRLIDQKLYHVHNAESQKHKHAKEVVQHQMHNFENQINRLKELLHKGRINKREFNKKKKQLLKKL